MNPLYKPDWEQTQKRFDAWWHNEIVDRCCIQIYAMKNGAPPRPPYLQQLNKALRDIDCFAGGRGGPSLAEGDTDKIEAAFELLRLHNAYLLENMYYGGEAFPTWQTGVFPFTNTMAAFVGCPCELQDDTGWVHPMLGGGALTDYDYHALRLDADNAWYRLDERMHRYAARHYRGDLIRKVWLGASSGDTLAALRGTENLLMDLMDCPAYVREFDQYLTRMSLELYDERFRIVYEDGRQGITDWFCLWAPSRYGTIQNDFAYMISPAMFEEVFLPSIEMQTKFYDRTFYHCDGVGNFKHIDALCALPGLNGIQVLPGEGKPSPLHYMTQLKKVQAAGKGLHIHIQAGEVETALRELSSKGLFICTSCGTQEETDYILKNMHKWTRE